MILFRTGMFSTLLILMLCVVKTASAAETKRIVLVAGKPSHPAGQHEFNAGVQLLAESLKSVPELHVDVVLNGWPEDDTLFEGADAAVFYMDGGGGHELVQENGRRLKLIDRLVDQGLGVACLHYGVEIVPDQAGIQFHKWIGGYYESMFSCNPMWEPEFNSFPDHPVTRGVKPFQVKDEWYFNIRFLSNLSGNQTAEIDGTTFTPILVAEPSDAVRNGPYVYPHGPYAHIQQNAGRAEAMMWTVVRPDGGRGFGFTGGHFHQNWQNESQRKLILNAFLWLAKVEVPESGVESSVSDEQIKLNLDPK